MTVENQIPYKSFTANGDQTDFALGFYVEDKGNFFVKQNDSVVSKDDYVFNNLTNSISFLTKPTANSKIEVERVTSADRSLTYATYNNSFRPEVLNHDIDRIWRKLQELGYTDSVLFLRLAKEIADRIAGDIYLQNQINELDDRVTDNTHDIADNTQKINELITNLSQEIADRIQADNILKYMFLNIVDTAIKEGTVNALAVMHVQDLVELEAIENVWNERTMYVKDLGHYQYNSYSESWIPVAYDVSNIKDGIESQKTINESAIRTVESIADLILVSNPKQRTDDPC